MNILYTSAWNIRLPRGNTITAWRTNKVQIVLSNSVTKGSASFCTVLYIYIYEIMRTCRQSLGWLIVKYKLPGFRESVSLVQSEIPCGSVYYIKMSKSMVAGVLMILVDVWRQISSQRCRESNKINYQHDIRIKNHIILHTTLYYFNILNHANFILNCASLLR